ncbi:MAG TPA: 6-bladed beta-propeller, partial [Gemmatimonadaceae bacterium]
MHRFLLIFAAVLACTANENSPGGAAGLVTVFDSTGDTVFARVEGQVPVNALRSMTPVMQIRPGADDTTLFAEVGEVEVDRANRIWLFDYQSNRLFLFDSTGALVRRIGRQGQGPGEFASGSGLATLADTGAAVWDPRNARISFFTADGDYRTSWPTPAGFFTSNGLYIDDAGTLYLKRPVTPPRGGEILGRMGLVRLKDGGAFTDSLVPVDLPVERETYMAVSSDGRSRSATSFRYAPNYYWDFHPDGYFVAAHGGRYEIVLERKGAKPIVIRRSGNPVTLLPDERAEEKEYLIWNMRQTQPSWSWTGGDLPDNKAPLTGITVTRDGSIWVRVAAASERI